MRKIATTLTLLCVAAFAQQKGTFTDARDKKAYKTVKIGEQVWLAENLSYKAEGSKCYAEGVKGVSDDSIAKNCAKFGRLYNWETAKKACPADWHLPNDKEWSVLMKFVNPSCRDNESCTEAGTKLKATSGWMEGGNGTDDFGFAALPGGFVKGGRFGGDGYTGKWWNAIEKDANEVWERMMDHLRNSVSRTAAPKGNLNSVRCIQGDEEAALKAIAEAEAKAKTAKEKAESEVTVGTFTDTRDKKTYKTVKIGEQTWMAENLNYDAKGSKCNGNKPANCATYGRLYDWATATVLPISCNKNVCASKVTAKHKGICPAGWHLPSEADWKVLIDLVDPAGSCKLVGSMKLTEYCKVVGNKLKATSGWNGNGTDAYGFSALPGGWGDLSDGKFNDVGNYDGGWWSASEETFISGDVKHGTDHAKSFLISFDGSSTFRDKKSSLFSVRCLKD